MKVLKSRAQVIQIIRTSLFLKVFRVRAVCMIRALVCFQRVGILFSQKGLNLLVNVVYCVTKFLVKHFVGC